MKRFVIEYANFQITRLEKEQKTALLCVDPENVIFTNNAYNHAIQEIDRAVRLCELGYTTIDETMRIISEPFAAVPELKREV